ncbi:MAG TPA: 30S ribosomal protein S16 [Chloroflexota bacterium]|nr:30S ribosomal protein S16 [Chloroflexota bacterium]
MLRIRLRRMGAKKKPSYRVVVADSRWPRDGRFLDILGHYNPRTEPSTVVVDREKAAQWLARGAQPTERVTRLFVREGILPETALPPRVREAMAAARAGHAARSDSSAPAAP